MILQALYDYYQRKLADQESGIAPQGFERKEIPFLIVIDGDGRFVTIEDTRSPEGKFLRGRRFLVPRTRGRSGSKSYATTQLLWDHIGYVLGVPRSAEPKEMRLAALQHSAWVDSLNALPQELATVPAIAAMRAFYSSGQESRVLLHPAWPDCARLVGCLMAFRLDGEPEPIPASEAVFAHVSRAPTAGDKNAVREDDPVGRCLITGEVGPIKRTHAKTAISKDAKALVSFQRNSGYDSYGKEQAFNAPISLSAESAYTTGLSTLLERGSRNRLKVGDATVVFWSDRKDSFEDAFASFFAAARKDDPDSEGVAVRALYSSVHKGLAVSPSATRFFVLGLAPSAFRIAVRFWHQGTVQEASARLREHFDDLEIVRSSKNRDLRDGEKYALHWLLCALDRDKEPNPDNLPPNLSGNIVRAILEGTPYPATLLQHAVRRIRAEQSVTRMRAAILKACLNRFHRIYPSQQKEIHVSLDLENPNAGYRLGRLFAVLEKVQEDAHRGINATIRDRFYGAASTSPVTVFPQLLKLHFHHLKKLDRPAVAGAFERWIGEICSGLPAGMPAHLNMEDQARFAIGYYHQRQALFTKTSKPTDS